jgi:hypothetical protein
MLATHVHSTIEIQQGIEEKTYNLVQLLAQIELLEHVELLEAHGSLVSVQGYSDQMVN